MRLIHALAHNCAHNEGLGPGHAITITYDGHRWYNVVGDQPQHFYRIDQLEKAQAKAESWGGAYDAWIDLATINTPARAAAPHQGAIDVTAFVTTPGFARYGFTDRYGMKCSLQASSLATQRAIWLGVDGNRMHLTQEHVQALLPLLQAFALTGHLPPPPDPTTET